MSTSTTLNLQLPDGVRPVTTELYTLEESRRAWEKRNLEGGTIYALKVEGVDCWLERGLSITDVVGFVVLRDKLPGLIDLPAQRHGQVEPADGGADGRRVVEGLIEEAGRGKWWVQRQHEAGKCSPACAVCYQKEKASQKTPEPVATAAPGDPIWASPACAARPTSNARGGLPLTAEAMEVGRTVVEVFQDGKLVSRDVGMNQGEREQAHGAGLCGAECAICYQEAAEVTESRQEEPQESAEGALPPYLRADPEEREESQGATLGM